MATGRVLVIAPNDDLRRSLVFALEADGYDVAGLDALPDYAWVLGRAFDCTVLDQKALTGPRFESIAFCVKARPVVLFAARPHPWLVEWVSDVVEMPLVDGGAIADAVRKSLHTGVP